MFCEKCGSQLSERASFCEKCGTPTSVYYAKLGREQYEAGHFAAMQPQPTLTKSEKPSMRFHGFIEVILWIMAALNTTDFIGYIVNVFINQNFAFSTFAQIENILCGAVYLLTAALCVFTFFRLAKYRKSGPTFLLFTFIAEIAIFVLSEVVYFSTVYYSTSGEAASGTNTLINSIFSNVTLPIACLVLMIVSIIYYKKRKSLFNK